MHLLDDVAPEISGEIRAVISQVVLVSGKVNGVEDFDGATAFGAWGALFLNADRHGERSGSD